MPISLKTGLKPTKEKESRVSVVSRVRKNFIQTKYIEANITGDGSSSEKSDSYTEENESRNHFDKSG